MKKLSQMFYLAKWFFGARFLGRKNPLQTVLFYYRQVQPGL